MYKLIFILLIGATQITLAQVNRRLAEAAFNKGVQSLNKGKLNDALNHFNTAIVEHPGYAEAYASRAITRERLGNTNGALVDYTLSLELDPNQYEVLFSRAVLRYQLGLYTFAHEDFTKLLDMPIGETNTIFYRRSAHSPGTDKMFTAQGFLHAQIYNYLGLTELELGNCSKAIIHINAAINLDNSEADYFVNRALAKLDCNHEDALEDFKLALELRPDHPIARHNLALESARRGSFAQAEQQLSETIQLDSMMLEPYLERGYYRMQNRNYTGSLKDFTKALSLEQNDPDIWLNRGLVREKLNDWQGAYSDYSKAIDLKADYTKAWLNRGNLLAAQLRYAEAIEDYSVAIFYDPEYGAAYYNRAIAFHSTGNHSRACNDLTKAIKLGIKVDDTMVKAICANK